MEIYLTNYESEKCGRKLKYEISEHEHNFCQLNTFSFSLFHNFCSHTWLYVILLFLVNSANFVIKKWILLSLFSYVSKNDKKLI